MKYTKYNLTDAMLQHLSATSNGRQVGGMSMRALEDRGLIERKRPSRIRAEKWYCTALGRLALATARAEGW